MPDFTPYAPLKKPEIDPVARSIAKPTAFAKPGTDGKQNKGTRFRALKSNPGRQRKRKPDKRFVRYY